MSRHEHDNEAKDAAVALPEPDFEDTRAGYTEGASAWGEAPRRQLEPMDQLLDGVLGRLAQPGQAGLSAVLDVWEQAAGSGWQHAKPVRLDEGTLVVEVPDGLTASRLQFDTQRLIDTLRGTTSGAVEKVRFRVAKS